MDQQDQPIGERLRLLRRYRGMTQAELGGLAGIGSSMISMMETGRRPLDRRSQISAIAAALRVSETDLVGTAPHISVDPEQSGPHALVPALRTALLGNSLSRAATDRARPVAELVTEESDLRRVYRSCDVVSLGARLPALIDELHVHADGPEDDQKLALATLIEACQLAALMAKELGYPDLAHVAALRAEDAARLLDDPVMYGKAAFQRFHTGSRDQESWDRSLRVVEHAAGVLEPHADSALATSVLGMLTLSAALAAAVLQNQAAAEHWLTESAGLAARVPDDMTANWGCFGTTNVALWRTAIAVERGEEGGKILEFANAVSLDKVTVRSRRADFLAETACGLARDRATRAEAVRWLHNADKAGPQRIRNSAAARDTVAYLLQQSRMLAGTRELRGMAARMGVPH